MLAPEFVATEITEFLKKFEDLEPNDILFLAEFSKRIISSYEKYKKEVNYKDG